ncbi:alpha/beta hydrolase [Caviibacter abscessus]|nr:alpha/beta hydrolase family protein [Caviibacter abscessus]
MNKKIPVTVILPDDYSSKIKYLVIYTLHGWSGNNKNFPEKTEIREFADTYKVIFVSHDGNYDSWYVDSDINSKSKYESFISKELVDYIDKAYSTDAKKEQRAITGLSMGGFGALYIGIRNQNIFGNIGSMSGGVEIESYKNNWGIINVINKDWDKYNIKDIAHQLIFTKTNIIIDCGVDDFFISVNRDLHKKLLALNIKHDYIERPGNHNWEYWKNSMKYQVLFFNENFKKSKI